MLLPALATIAFSLSALAPTQQPRESRFRRLTELPRVPRAEIPTARPSWGRYEGFLLRLGFEDAFAEREAVPVLSEEGMEVLAATLQPAELDAALARLSASAPSAVRIRYRLDMRTGDQVQELLAGSEVVPVNRLAVLGDHRLRRAVVDFDVEIAQATFMADPIVATIATGATLALDLRPLPDGSWLGEILVRNAVEGRNEAIHLGYSAMEGVARNPVEFEETGLVARLAGGTPVTWRLPAHGGASLELELAVDATAGKQQGADVLFLPTLAAPPVGFQAPPMLLGNAHVEDGFEPPEPPERLSLEQVIENAAAGGNAWGAVLVHEESGTLFLRGAEAPALGAELKRAALEEAATRQVSLEVRVEGGQGPRTLAVFSGPVAVDTWVGFSAGRVQETVDDWDVEVAQGARVADPSMALVEDGNRGSLRLGHDGMVDLDLTLAVLEDITARPMKLGHQMVGTGESGLPLQPDERLVTEEPVLRDMSLSGSYPLAATPGSPAGTLRLERSASQLFAPGHRVVVELTVR